MNERTRFTIGLATMIIAAQAVAGLTHWAVDPMSETPYLPDTVPADGRQGGAVQIIAAKGEYEPGSFVLRSDVDLGKVKLEVTDLKSSDGKVFPKAKLDLKVVKVWYQSGNAWFSYFADKGAKLCPELLVNDEDLIRVDTAKKCNYARLTEKDGRVHEFWLGYPAAFKDRAADLRGTGHFRLGDSFVCMKENFRDAKTLQPVALPKDVSKQFFLTANVTKDTLAGLYRGEVKVNGEGQGQQWSVPVSLRVLPFELPRPMCYFDPEKPFVSWFCDYINLDMICDQNGNDMALAKRQMTNICRDFAAHGQYVPSFGWAEYYPEIVKAGGQDYCDLIPRRHGSMRPGAMRDMRVNARRERRLADRRYGKDSHPVFGYGDEYGIDMMRKIRPMVKLYQKYGFRFPMNCQAGYSAGIDIADIFWPPVTPDHASIDMTARYNDATGGAGTFGWYACQHVGVENPAFARRQYGFGPYRAGLSCNFNYAHHIDEWNDSVADLYRPMALNYGCYDGVIDTIAWEGFREGQDDIRYATVLKRLALPLAAGTDVDARAEARLALQLLADAADDATDLTTLRQEMIRHILKLMRFKGTTVADSSGRVGAPSPSAPASPTNATDRAVAAAPSAPAALSREFDFYDEECANPALKLDQRVKLIGTYVAKLCDIERYDEADRLVRTHLPTQQAATPSNCVPSLLELLADVRVYADDMEGALAVAKEIAAIDPAAGLKRGASIARTFDRADLERSFVDKMSDPDCFAHYVRGWGSEETPDFVKRRAAAFIGNPKNPPSARIGTFASVFATDNSPDALKCLDLLLKLPTNGLEQAGFDWRATYKRSFAAGDWKRTVAYYRLMEKCGRMAKDAENVKFRRIYAVSLINAGEKDCAAEACARFAEAPGLSATDALLFRVLGAFARGQSAAALVRGAKLETADRAKVLQAAGQYALAMELTDSAEELAKDYAACFIRHEERALKVMFSPEPIRSVADWRAVYPKLEKALCDRPFGADAEALKTDVNTQRETVEKKDGDNLKTTVEVTSVCDRYALHIFLRVADPDARKVEHGFQNGIRTETYFAPGDGLPYQCLGANPLQGVTFLMNSLYDSLHVKRLEIGDGFRSEVAFTDTDYVTHLVFDWSNFYDKLPKDGGHYRFECLCWAPGGHRTWAGSRGIHHSSDWGKLVFSLTPAQLTEIRRELVLSSYRNWRKVGTRGARSMLQLDAFLKWSDETIGDPSFYANDLKTLEGELSDAAKRVKPEMDDATVNEVFEKAVPYWMGLRHVLDAKRKVFLGDELIEKGE